MSETENGNDCGRYALDESYKDFIFKNNTIYYDSDIEGCAQKVDENWSVGYGQLPAGLDMTVSDLDYYIIPKLYAAVDSSSFDESGINNILEQPSLDVKGRGVIIGIIDAGERVIIMSS